MKKIYARKVSDLERVELEKGLRSHNAVFYRHCRIILASLEGYTCPQIAEILSMNIEQIRRVIKAFNSQGLEGILPKGRRRRKTLLDREIGERIVELAHERPRNHGVDRPVWTLRDLAKVSFERGITPKEVSYETIRRTFKRLGVNWKRLKRWLTSPDLQYEKKKRRINRIVEGTADRPDIERLHEDESWFSRFKVPPLVGWSPEGDCLKAPIFEAKRGDPEPKAIAAYGALNVSNSEVFLRFTHGQPNSERTKTFLRWLLRIYEKRGCRWLIVIWDNASFHTSLKKWAWENNCRAHREGGIKILLLFLPKKSPWLNPMEPRWIHCKRRVYDTEGAPTIAELKERAYGYFFPNSC